MQGAVAAGVDIAFADYVAGLDVDYAVVTGGGLGAGLYIAGNGYYAVEAAWGPETGLNIASLGRAAGETDESETVGGLDQG